MELETKGFEKLGRSVGPAVGDLWQGTQKLGTSAKNLFTGTGGAAGRMTGGVIGLGERIIDRSAGMIGSTIEAGGKFAKNHHIIASALAIFGGFKLFKAWQNRRKGNQAIEELRANNSAMEAQLAVLDTLTPKQRAAALAAARMQTSAEVGQANPKSGNRWVNMVRGGLGQQQGQ